MSYSCVDLFPPELFFSICSAVFHAGIPAPVSSLDPVTVSSTDSPTSLPSSQPPSHWPEAVARKTLVNLCLVNHAWYEAAKPWLWRKVEVRLPKSWMAFVDEIIPGEEDINEEEVGQSIQSAANIMLAMNTSDDDEAKRLQECLIASLSSPDSSIPPELLSPPASREPSPRRLRTKSKSPARWKLLRSINDAVHSVMMDRDGSGLYVPMPNDPHPGRYVQHIDFNHFRTIGMRRSIGEGEKGRFVTGDRLESILKETPNLTAFGATEYMDGALNLSVLKELLLRGSPSRGRGRSSRGRTLTIEHDDAEEMDRERWKECKDLVAVDFTGCVSAIFYSALREFVNTYINIAETSDSESSDDERRGLVRGRRGSFDRTSKEPVVFPGLQRLCLLGVKAMQPEILHPFILAFPSLTHLDVSCTRVTPDLLSALSVSRTVRLQSLAIGRCTRLTGNSIADFLIHGTAARELQQLNIYGDKTFPSALSVENLTAIIEQAPCFKSGNLTYLDLSSSPITATHLSSMIAQPMLRSLGLSYIPTLPLAAIATFLRDRAPNVEVLSIISTTPELSGSSSFKATMALHTVLVHPLSSVPISFSFSLSSTGGSGTATPCGSEAPSPPTRLRVLELSLSLLNSLGAGAGTWRIVRSKGGRGWYVDVAAGWVAGPGQGETSVLRRGLSRTHPIRVELEKLADANGNVSSGVGWHARKMEVLFGHGLLGREDGLYGAVSFAYQG